MAGLVDRVLSAAQMLRSARMSREGLDDRRSALARGTGQVLLLPLLLLVACGSGDPLEEVRTMQTAGRYAESLELLRRLVAERPEDAEVYYLYGATLVQSGDPSLAQFALRRAMEDEEWIVPAGLLLASSLLATQNSDAAVDVRKQLALLLDK